MNFLLQAFADLSDSQPEPSSTPYLALFISLTGIICFILGAVFNWVISRNDRATGYNEGYAQGIADKASDRFCNAPTVKIEPRQIQRR